MAPLRAGEVGESYLPVLSAVVPDEMVPETALHDSIMLVPEDFTVTKY